MDWSMPGFPVLHHLPQFAQTHVRWVGDVIQPSHPLSPPSPPALSFCQHQGLFQWVGSSHQVAKVLELNHQTLQWIFRIDFLYDGLVWSPCCPWDSQESSPAPQLESINPDISTCTISDQVKSHANHCNSKYCLWMGCGAERFIPFYNHKGANITKSKCAVLWLWGVRRAGGSWIRDRQAQYPGRITLHVDPMDPDRNLNS